MGANLYLYSIYNANRAIWHPKFIQAADERDHLIELGNTEEAEEMQELVAEYYDKMQEVGYYRDSYNSTGFLRLLDLSYCPPNVSYREFAAVAPFEPIENDCEDTIHGWGLAECQTMLDLINARMEDGTFQRNFGAEFGPAGIRNHR